MESLESVMMHPPGLQGVLARARVDGTLETSLLVIGMHPKVVGIASELILGAIEAVVLTEVLRRKETNCGGGNVMTGNVEVHVLSIFADQGPASDAGPSHGGGTIDGLDLANVALLVGDKVAPIGSDGEGAAGFDNDINNVVSNLA